MAELNGGLGPFGVVGKLEAVASEIRSALVEVVPTAEDVTRLSALVEQHMHRLGETLREELQAIHERHRQELQKRYDEERRALRKQAFWQWVVVAGALLVAVLKWLTS